MKAPDETYCLIIRLFQFRLSIILMIVHIFGVVVARLGINTPDSIDP